MKKVIIALIATGLLSGFGFGLPQVDFSAITKPDGTQGFIFIYQKKHAKYKDRMLQIEIGEAKVCNYGWDITLEEERVKGYIYTEGVCKPKPKDE